MEAHLKLIGQGRTKEKHSRTAKFPTRVRRASELHPTTEASDLFGAAFVLALTGGLISIAVQIASFLFSLSAAAACLSSRTETVDLRLYLPLRRRVGQDVSSLE